MKFAFKSSSMIKTHLRRNVTLVFLMLSFLSASVSGQNVISVAFKQGYLGTQGTNTNQADNIKTFATLGILRASFEQTDTDADGLFDLSCGSQGNDVCGTIKLYLSNGTVISRAGALNWRETSGNIIDVLGFIFDAGQADAIINYGSNQTYTIKAGKVARTSTTLGLRSYRSSVTFVNDEDRSGNAATNGLLGALNAELTNTPQPSVVSLNPASVTEGTNLVFNITLSATTTSEQVYTIRFTGTATSGSDFSTTLQFTNNVVNNNDGTISVPAGVSSFSITVPTIDDQSVESSETVILSLGAKTATGNILDNDANFSVLSFTPTTAKSGETVTITGANFTGVTGVTIGGVAVRSFNVVSSTQITAVVAANANVNNIVSVITSGGTASLAGFTFSCLSNALDFDGVDDYIQVGAPLPLTGSTNFTIEAWVKPAALDLAYHGFLGLQPTSGRRAPSLWVGPSGSLHTDAYGSGTRYDMLVDNFFTANKWTHVAWVKNGSTFIIYKNGVQVHTRQAVSTLEYANENFWIGKVDNFLNGSLDEVRIWNIARTQEQISGALVSDLVGNETGLVAYYNFNQGTAGSSNTGITTLNNLTSNTALHGTLTTMSRTGSRSNFVTGVGPLILTQPVSTLAVCPGATTGNSISVSAVGSALKYQWYSNATNSTTGGTIITGATSAIFSVPMGEVGLKYYYVVVSSDCSPTTETSTVSAVTVSSARAPIAGEIRGTASICGTGTTQLSVASSALDFDGTNDYITAPNGVYFNDDTYTIEGWVNVRSHNNWQRLIDFGTAEARNNVLFALSQGTTGRPALHIFNGSGTITALNATESLPLNEWVHVAAVRDGNSAHLYINGRLSISTNALAFATPNVTRTSCFIGESLWSGDAHTNGKIGELRIWNVARTQAEIRDNMHAVLSAQSELELYYRFDQGIENGSNASNTSITDYSGNDRAGSLLGFGLTAGASSNWTTRNDASVTSSWSSGTTSVATVNATGLVTGVAVGTSIITYTVAGNGGCSNATAIRAVTVSGASVAGTAAAVSTEICIGSTAQLSLTGNTGVVQWQSSPDNSTWTDISGATTASYTTAALSQNTYFRAKVTNGACAALFSNALTITLTTSPATPALSGTQEVCVGGTSQFRAEGESGALAFNGTNNFVVMPNNINAFNISSDITLECWVKVNTLPTDWVRIIGKGGTAVSSTDRPYGLWLATDGSILWQIYGSATMDLLSSTRLQTNRWYHVAVNRIGNTFRIYIDGVESASRTLAITPASSTQPFRLGFAGYHTYLNGVLDEVRVWNVGRTAAQISANKDIEIAPQAGLVAYYQFNQGIAGGSNTGLTTLNDNSGNSYNGTLNSFTLTGTSSNWVSRSPVTPTGTWTTSDANVATVNASSGLVTGVAAGTATISYTLTGSGGCADVISTRSVTVTAAPVAGTLSGTQDVCVGATTTFSSTQTGGTWSTSAANIATVDATTGVVTGVAAGTATITYTVAGSGGCAAATATRTVTVTAAPVVGTLSGSQDICVGGTSTFTAAQTLGNALSFTGTERVSIPTNSSLNFTGTSVNMTLEAWVNFSPNSSIRTIIGNKTAGSQTGGYAFYVNSWGTTDRKLVFEFWGSAAVSTTATVPSNVWTHVAAVLNNGSVSFFINGESVAVSGGSTTDIRTSSNAINIGAFGDNNFRFTGSIDDVRIWNIARTSQQIQNSYESEISAPQSGLVAYYKFNEGAPSGNNTSINSVSDASGNNYSGTLTGFTRTGSTSNFVASATSSSSSSSGTWTTSDANIATVNSSGLVTGVATGTATITYTVAGSGGCADATATRTVTINALPAAPVAEATQAFCQGVGGSSAISIATQSTMTAYRNASLGTVYKMRITGNRSGGTVWGTDVYTDDSNIPTAAVHAGVIANGETKDVFIKLVAGRSSYNSTTRNGVTTSNWGSWGYSYEFVSQPASTTSLVATALADHTLRWYTTETGGTASTTAPSVDVSTAGTTNYYVSQVNESGCEGPRTAIAAVVNPAPVIAYGSASYRFERTKAITAFEPTSTGATVASYAISPELPAGLSFNTTTGAISGTPTAVVASATYTVTATTAASCTATATFTLETFNAPAPTGLSYNPSTQTVRRGTAINNMPPITTGGPIETYTISPALPAGLTISASTGIISGTLTAQVTGSVTYTVTGSNTGGSVTATVTLVYNTAPTDIGLSPTSVPENEAIGTTVGTLTVTDIDEGDTHTYTLVSGEGDTDNASFTIDGTSLKTNAVFDFETKTSYSIRIRVTDAGGLSYEEVFTITVTDVDEDNDGDGVMDSKEREDGTDPFDRCSFKLASQTVEPSTAWKNADCDNDGLSNQQEKDLKTDPLKPDTDGDGVIDGKEVSDNTDPLNQCSLKLESQTLTPSQAWLNGDCNGDGIRNGQNILISMYATRPQLQSDGSYNLRYIIRVRNLRPERVTLTGIQKNLANVFTLPANFRVTGVRATGTGHLTASSTYDGRVQLNVLGAGSGIGGYTLDSVTVDLNLAPNGFAGNVQSTATVTGTGAFNFSLNIPSTDTTVTGGTYPTAGAPTPLVIPRVDYIIPDAFSPNRDGINDRFVVIRPFQSVISLQVFNRWGNVVYRNENYNNDWDGRGMSQYGAGDLPEGTYFYLIRSREPNGQVKQFKGSIMLKRN